MCPIFRPQYNHGYALIAATAFVEATGSYWSPEERHITQSVLFGTTLDPYLDAEGKPIVDRNGNRLYIVPAGFYWALGYSPLTNEETFFPNELGGNPSEGFADSFANFILHSDVLPAEEVRLQYIEDNLSDWISDIIEVMEE